MTHPAQDFEEYQGKYFGEEEEEEAEEGAEGTSADGGAAAEGAAGGDQADGATAATRTPGAGARAAAGGAAAASKTPTSGGKTVLNPLQAGAPGSSGGRWNTYQRPGAAPLPDRQALQKPDGVAQKLQGRMAAAAGPSKPAAPAGPQPWQKPGAEYAPGMWMTFDRKEPLARRAQKHLSPLVSV